MQIDYSVNASPNEIGHRAFIAYLNEFQRIGSQNTIRHLDAEVTKYIKEAIVSEKHRWLEYLPTEIGIEILQTILKRMLDHDDKNFTKTLINTLIQRLDDRSFEDLSLKNQKKQPIVEILF